MAIDWIAEKAKQRKLEMDVGRKTVNINMAQGVINQIDEELGIKSTLNHSHPDVRAWTVVTLLPQVNGTKFIHEESFWDFPSNELKTKIMLLGGKYGNA